MDSGSFDCLYYSCCSYYCCCLIVSITHSAAIIVGDASLIHQEENTFGKEGNFSVSTQTSISPTLASIFNKTQNLSPLTSILNNKKKKSKVKKLWAQKEKESIERGRRTRSRDREWDGVEKGSLLSFKRKLCEEISMTMRERRRWGKALGFLSIFWFERRDEEEIEFLPIFWFSHFELWRL